MKPQKIYLVIAAVGMLGWQSQALNAQDLFKKNKGGLSDAFSNRGDNEKSSTENRAGYGFAELEKFVLNNKFKSTEKVTERGYRFTFEYKEWTLPTVLEISKSNTNIWATMVLKRPKIDITKHPDRLLKLLEWNGTYGDSFFSIIPSSKAITLVGALQLNGPIEDKEVKEHLEYLGRLAIRTQDLWDTKKWSDAPQHVGSWNGEDGNRMKIKLETNGQFQLTSSSGSVTKGTYTISDGKITMTETTTSGGQGERIAGNIKFTDSNHFVLTVNGASLKFVRQ